MGKIIRVLRTVTRNLTSYNGFKYPKSGYVKSPDWDIIARGRDGFINPYYSYISRGLSGITKDYNGYPISRQFGFNNNRIKWIVLELNFDDIKPVSGRYKLGRANTIYCEYVKFKRGKVIYSGSDVVKAALMVFDTIEDYIKIDPFAFRFIKNPTKNVQLTAVNQNGTTIQYIENPDKEVQLEAIKKNIDSIKYIKNPHQEVVDYISKILNNE
jgi:hypothetical protein